MCRPTYCTLLMCRGRSLVLATRTGIDPPRRTRVRLDFITHLAGRAAVLRDAVLGAAVLGLRVSSAVGAPCRGSLHIDHVRVLKALLRMPGRSVSSLNAPAAEL